MLKYLSIFIFLFLISTKITFASYESTRKEYQSSLNTYRDQLLEYRTARSEYLTYKTLVSKNRAISSSQKFLESRYLVSINYLNLIQSRLNISETPYIDLLQANTLTTQISDLKLKFNSLIPLINNISNIEDIVSISKDNDKFINSMEVLGYKAQSLIIDARIKSYLNNYKNLNNSVEEQVRRISLENKIPSEKFERWLIDVQQKGILANDAYNKGNNIINNIGSKKELDNIRNHYINSKQYIQEGNRFLLEILRNIKIK